MNLSASSSSMSSSAVAVHSSFTSFESLLDDLSSSSSSNSSREPIYRTENYMPPFVGAIIGSCCGGLLIIAIIVVYCACCRGKKLLETDEDEAIMLSEAAYDEAEEAHNSKSREMMATGSVDCQSRGAVYADEDDYENEEWEEDGARSRSTSGSDTDDDESFYAEGVDDFAAASEDGSSGRSAEGPAPVQQRRVSQRRAAPESQSTGSSRQQHPLRLAGARARKQRNERLWQHEEEDGVVSRGGSRSDSRYSSNDEDTESD